MGEIMNDLEEAKKAYDAALIKFLELKEIWRSQQVGHRMSTRKMRRLRQTPEYAAVEEAEKILSQYNIVEKVYTTP